MISWPRPFNVMRWPITPVSPPNRRCQNSYVSTTVFGATGESSAAVNVRPCRAFEPHSRKNSALTCIVGICSGEDSPVRLTTLKA